MDINQAFPTKYLKAADLQGREYNLRIKSVIIEDVGDGDNKPVLYFEKTAKGVALNKTNAMAIAAAYGAETNAWIGQAVVVFPATTQFQGRTVDCIRLRPHYPQANGVPGGAPLAAATATPAAVAAFGETPNLDSAPDGIPY